MPLIHRPERASCILAALSNHTSAYLQPRFTGRRVNRQPAQSAAIWLIGGTSRRALLYSMEVEERLSKVCSSSILETSSILIKPPRTPLKRECCFPGLTAMCHDAKRLSAPSASVKETGRVFASRIQSPGTARRPLRDRQNHRQQYAISATFSSLLNAAAARATAAPADHHASASSYPRPSSSSPLPASSQNEFIAAPPPPRPVVKSPPPACGISPPWRYAACDLAASRPHERRQTHRFTIRLTGTD